MSAVISACGQYRYMLTRGTGRRLVIIMLNPSTADAKLDDPTIRRCMAFAALFGYDGIVVLNLYAFRATKPADLWTQSDPIGLENDAHLEMLTSGDDVLCAWGVNARPERVAYVVKLIQAAGGRLKCLGTTKHGAPRHPLYVRGDQPLIEWTPT